MRGREFSCRFLLDFSIMRLSPNFETSFYLETLQDNYDF